MAHTSCLAAADQASLYSERLAGTLQCMRPSMAGLQYQDSGQQVPSDALRPGRAASELSCSGIRDGTDYALGGRTHPGAAWGGGRCPPGQSPAAAAAGATGSCPPGCPPPSGTPSAPAQVRSSAPPLCRMLEPNARAKGAVQGDQPSSADRCRLPCTRKVCAHGLKSLQGLFAHSGQLALDPVGWLMEERRPGHIMLLCSSR